MKKNNSYATITIELEEPGCYFGGEWKSLKTAIAVLSRTSDNPKVILMGEENKESFSNGMNSLPCLGDDFNMS